MRKAKRSRGGATTPCPECDGPSEVLVTRRKGQKIVRNRKCKSRSCGHRFTTEEKIARSAA